jgi:hypothetical protein
VHRLSFIQVMTEFDFLQNTLPPQDSSSIS